jgi:Raf kinase inhibitor-like YbhB/YbcL family protein
VGTWVHWVAAGIDPQTRRIEGQLPGGAVEGTNDFKETGYGGPQPPPGDGVHRYFFYLYALREPSGLAAGCTADDLRRAVVGKELARGLLIGTYER